MTNPIPDRRPSRRTSVPGVLALVLGGLAILAGLVPCVGFLAALPLAGAGLVLGIVGLVAAALGQRTAIGVPVAGTVASAAGLLVGGLWLGLFGLVAHGARTAADEQARAAAAIPPADPAGDKPPREVKEAGGLRQWSAKVSSGGKAVTVDYFAPAKGKDFPVLLLVHGADGLQVDFWTQHYRHMAREMANRGFLVAFPHYFERTGTRFADPVAMVVNYGPWFNAVQDALAAARTQPEADGKRPALMGVSLGGTLVIDVGAKNARQVGAVVDVFGGVPDIIANQIQTMPPTLILHGGKDTIVSIDDSRKLDALLTKKGVPHALHVYPDGGHGFAGADLRDCLDRSAAFLHKHLGPAGD